MKEEMSVSDFLRKLGLPIYENKFQTITRGDGDSTPYAIINEGENCLRGCNYKSLDGNRSDIKVVTVGKENEEKAIGLFYEGKFYRVEN
jgi:hypothetical protein